MLAIQLMRLSRESRQAAVVAERNFTGVIVQLEAAADAMSKGLAKEAGEHLDRARESLREARRSVRALRPQALEQQTESVMLACGIEAKHAVAGSLPRQATVFSTSTLKRSRNISPPSFKLQSKQVLCLSNKNSKEEKYHVNEYQETHR